MSELILKEQKLNAELLAASATDLTQFEGVELDVTDNLELFSNDILIPKLWLIQATSQLRKERKAQDGDIVDSRSEEILWAPNTANDHLPIIVLKTFKRWQTFKLVMEKGEMKKHFVSSEVMVLGKNHNLPYEEIKDGMQLVRRQVISAYVVLGRDLLKGIAKPYIVDFASTSKGAGRALVSDVATLNKGGRPSYVAWFKFGAKEETKDKESFFVKTISFGGNVPSEAYPLLKDSLLSINKMIANNTIEIDDRDLKDVASSAVNSSVADNADV